MQCIKIRHEEKWNWIKEWTICPSDTFFLVFSALVPTSWTDLGTCEGSLFILVIWCDKMGWNRRKIAVLKMEVFKDETSNKGDCAGHQGNDVMCVDEWVLVAGKHQHSATILSKNLWNSSVMHIKRLLSLAPSVPSHFKYPQNWCVAAESRARFVQAESEFSR